MSADDQDGEKHTRFLSTMIGMDEAFRLPCTVTRLDGIIIALDKKFVQADQGSDMNVMSSGLVRHLGLILHALNEVGFRGLSMRTTEGDRGATGNLYGIVIKGYCIYRAFGPLPPPAREPSLLHSHDSMNLPISTIYMDDFFGGSKDFGDLTPLAIYCDRGQHYEKHLRLRSLPHLSPETGIKS